MLLTRVITAAVLLLILVVAAQAATMFSMPFWRSATALRWPNGSNSPSFPELRPTYWAVALRLWGPVLLWAQPILTFFGSVYLALQLAVACIWLAVTAVCYNARNIGFGVARPAATVLAFVVTTATWLAVWQFLRLGSWPLLISVFMIVWLADACAYFAGRLFGKNRMAPAISPKKTWEGVAGGLVSVLVAALAAYLWLPHEMVLTSILLDKAGFAAGLLMILVLVAVSVSGDLFESSLKRQAGVKDSGRLLPGHGGFYDRLDSSLAVLPTAAAMLMIV